MKPAPPLITNACNNMTNQMTRVEESDDTESELSHNVINKNYVNESAVTEYGSCHVEINMNGVDTLDDIDSRLCHAEVKMNGINVSDIIESESCHVKVKTSDVEKSDVIDSRSGHVRNRTANNCRDDLNLAVTTHKKMYVLSSSMLSAQAEGHLDVIEGHSDIVDGRNSASFNDADRHYHHRVNSSESDSERTENMEVNHDSGAEAVKLVSDSQCETTSDVQSTCANNRILPSSNCDVNSDGNTSHVGTKLALSSEKKLRRDRLIGVSNGETDDAILAMDSHHKGSEAGRKPQPFNCRLVSNDLSTVHRVDSESDHQINSQPVLAKSASNKLRTDESSEMDKECKCSKCGLLKICDDSSETDRQQRHTYENLPQTHNADCVDTDQNTNCQLLTVDTTNRHQLVNCQSPPTRRKDNKTDRQQQYINCALTSDNLTKARSMGIETDQKTNVQMQMAGSDRDRQKSLRVECRVGEAEQSQKLINSQLPTVHKHQMLVDCDVNVPHNVWTTVINHNSLPPHSDDSANVHSQSAVHSLYSTDNEVWALFVLCCHYCCRLPVCSGISNLFVSRR